MQLSITREVLLHGLKTVLPAVATRSALPALTHVLLEADNGVLRLTASNTELVIRTRLPADIQENGSALLPGQKLAQIAKELPEGGIRLRSQDGAVQIAAGQGRFRIVSLDVQDFPTTPAVPFQSGSVLDAADLVPLISGTVFAAASNDPNPVLNSALWQISGNMLRMVTTDKFRLAKVEIPLKGREVKELEAIVPGKALQVVLRTIDPDAEVRIASTDSHIGFLSGETEVMARLIEGPYPAYDRVIPRSHEREIVLERDDFITSVRRVALMSTRDLSNRVELDLQAGRLKLSVKTPDLGSGKDEIPGVELRGEPMEIAFNASYLLDILSHVDAPQVRLQLNGPNTTVTFRPIRGEEAGEGEKDQMYLLTPLRA